MRKFGFAVVGAVSLTLLSAASALAQSNIPPGDNDVAPNVIVRAPGGTAFTGSSVTVWMALAATLLVLGVVFLIAARSRARTARS